VWYFTPYYSVLRATTEAIMPYLAVAVALLAVMTALTVRAKFWKLAALGGAAVIIVGFFTLEAKVWGVVLMGVAVLVLAALPWLDRSPVKSIRYKGPIFKTMLALFIVSFLVLGYLGTLPPTPGRTLVAQIFTFVYFAFFFLMPWYSAVDSWKPVPERIEKHA
ncbi:MAG: cytochrome bc complex cytochrome b subunit, partial [Burkholderiales bacterium]|nr:cytochrome bc complex cytochrome b subunit [Burkholderiales bacterium]